MRVNNTGFKLTDKSIDASRQPLSRLYSRILWCMAGNMGIDTNLTMTHSIQWDSAIPPKPEYSTIESKACEP